MFLPDADALFVTPGGTQCLKPAHEGLTPAWPVRFGVRDRACIGVDRFPVFARCIGGLSEGEIARGIAIRSGGIDMRESASSMKARSSAVDAEPGQ